MEKVKIKKRLDSKKVLVSSSDEYFDDCPVCRLMKMAEAEDRFPAENELKEAFTKANTQN